MKEEAEQQMKSNNDKRTIVMIYLCVAIISAIIIACFMFLGKHSRRSAEEVANDGSNLVIIEQKMTIEESIGKFDIMKLEKDFTATNQDGDIVNFQSLKGKVWVFAQFYGSCPECNSVNLGILTELYKKYASDPNFQIVTINVMEEENGVDAMKDMANSREVQTEKWWFLTADVDEINKFCSEEMLYTKFEKNTNQKGDGMQGAVQHDMGMAVFDGGMIMKAKVDVYSQIKAKNDLGVELKKKQLDLEIAAALKALKKN